MAEKRAARVLSWYRYEIGMNKLRMQMRWAVGVGKIKISDRMGRLSLWLWRVSVEKKYFESWLPEQWRAKQQYNQTTSPRMLLQQELHIRNTTFRSYILFEQVEQHLSMRSWTKSKFYERRLCLCSVHPFFSPPNLTTFSLHLATLATPSQLETLQTYTWTWRDLHSQSLTCISGGKLLLVCFVHQSNLTLDEWI